MTVNVKTLIDGGLSAATAVSFSVPEAGPLIAAALTGGQALFDTFFQVSDETDPAAMFVTQGDLDQAVLDIKAAIINADFKSDLDDHFDVVTTLNDQLATAWDHAADGKGPAYVGEFASSVLESDWIQAMDALKAPLTDDPPRSSSRRVLSRTTPNTKTRRSGSILIPLESICFIARSISCGSIPVSCATRASLRRHTTRTNRTSASSTSRGGSPIRRRAVPSHNRLPNSPKCCRHPTSRRRARM